MDKLTALRKAILLAKVYTSDEELVEVLSCTFGELNKPIHQYPDECFMSYKQAKEKLGDYYV